MHDGMPYGRNQGQGQGHSREVDRQSPTGLIFIIIIRSTSKSPPNNIRGGKCPSVRTSVRPSTKSFFDFNEIWYVGRGRRVMRRYAVWPDRRSRSRSRALQSLNSFHFQNLSPPPFTMGAGK